MLAEGLLDQHRRHVLTAAADDVALAVDEVEPAVLVDVAQVAGQEPAVPERPPGRLGILEVRRHAGRRVHRDLADGARRQRGAVVVEHLYLDARDGRAARAGTRRGSMVTTPASVEPKHSRTSSTPKRSRTRGRIGALPSPRMTRRRWLRS